MVQLQQTGQSGVFQGILMGLETRTTPQYFLIDLKRMVHLIYKSHLKAVFVCTKFYVAFSFAQNLLVLV